VEGNEYMNQTTTTKEVLKVLDGLKDFQRNTVDYVFQRMYLDDNPTPRFLIADEVGLGKTLVARGLIARAIEHLWNKKPDLRIDIVYICSNVQIARQNINRLNVTGKKDFALASRITLLPTQIQDLSKNNLNFVSFTPGTSFDLRSSMGIVRERALLYDLLNKAWGVREWGMGPLNVLQGDAYKANFRRFVREQRVTSEETLSKAYIKALKENPGMIRRFENLCSRFKRARIHIPDEDRLDRSQLIGELRSLLAKTCLNALEPDIIILDEFQRFKHLLDEEDETSVLARELFNCSDDDSESRVILLSATPYKMYTMQHESMEDDHYQDFLRTVDFLFDEKNTSEELKKLLNEYRLEMFRIKTAGVGRLQYLKQEIESRLKKVMIRTERLSVTPDRDGMLKEKTCKSKLKPREIKSYISLQKIARIMESGNTLEYWKSAPYLLNFMDEYDFKRKFKDSLSRPGQRIGIAKELEASEGLVLSHDFISKYQKIGPNNTRMRWLLDEMIESEAWRLLWIPPALSYYKPNGLFDNEKLKGLTKRLIFSSWKVVPKTIATLLSYEAERRMICSYQKNAQNTAEARKRRKPLLKFTKSKGRLTGMPVFGILYPCLTLAMECDPLKIAQNHEGLLSVKEIISKTKEVIDGLLARLPDIESKESNLEDEAWYWAAPILLDMVSNEKNTREWFSNPKKLSELWSGGGEDDDSIILDKGEEQSRWSDHVEYARKVITGNLELGKKPHDLEDVLSLIALASPGVTSLRALRRVTNGKNVFFNGAVKIGAARMAWSFRTLFNTPETMALLRSIDNETPYWKVVLNYCADGCLQSVTDEFVHVLNESLGLLNKPDEATVKEISDAVCNAMSLRTSSLNVDFIDVPESSRTYNIESKRMRARYALRFGEEKSEDGKEVTRTDQVRDAFNSPFWPFVLTTTSIGQEGLDFHPYCHAIIHWNLPSNPVDLEQREGRIHRYKGHAVRKNVAKKYGTTILNSADTDPWDQLFELARRERVSTANDLIPYWIYPLKDGAHIERYVPTFPLSRDFSMLNSLRKSQTIYRMVFGQARQEDLLAYLVTNFDETEIAEITNELLINLSP
jgi:hypothetical protein